VLRLAVGLVFAMHGYQKLSGGLEGTAGFLSSLGFPLASTFAVILIAAELLGGIALMLGFLTHMTSKLLAVVAIVALFTVHIGNGFFMSTGGYEYILVLFAASISLMISGAGKYSVDALMKKPEAAQQMQ
jgi:putative oxidoreductase